MKHSISALLTVCLLLAGCGEAAEVRQTDTLSEENSEIIAETKEYEAFAVRDDLPEINFDGDTLRMVTTDWYDASTYIYAEAENGDILNDALYASRRSVEERFNMKITLEINNGTTQTADLIHNMVMAGDNAYDLLYNHDCSTIRNGMDHDLLDIKSIEQIDFSKPWWKGTSEVFTINGTLPVTANCLSLSGVFMGFVLAVNKELAAANDIPIPYDDVRAGTWYLDDLISITKNMKADLDGNGKFTSTDQYGFVTSDYGSVGLLSSLGGTILQKNEDGFIYMRDDLEFVVHIMEKTEELFGNGLKKFSGTDYGIDEFSQGLDLFMYGESRVLYQKGRDTRISYGILPFPKLDESQDEYRSAGYDIYWGIPKTAYERTAIIGTAVEAISCYNYNKVLPVVWEMVLGSKLSDAPDDAEMFSIIRDTQYVDLGYAFNDTNSALMVYSFLMNKTKSGEAISYIEKFKERATAAIEKINSVYPEVDG